MAQYLVRACSYQCFVSSSQWKIRHFNDSLMILVALALIESDAEGIGGSGFVECISEHINSVISSLT
jgi:hypothetical protein